MAHWYTCEDCHREVLAEHGPVCPECLLRRKEHPEEYEIVLGGTAYQPVTMIGTILRKRRAEPVDETEIVPGCCH